MSERTDEELRTAYIGQTEERGRRAVYNLGVSDARAAHAAEVEGLRAENERLRIELGNAQHKAKQLAGRLLDARSRLNAALSATPETTRKNDDE